MFRGEQYIMYRLELNEQYVQTVTENTFRNCIFEI